MNFYFETNKSGFLCLENDKMNFYFETNKSGFLCLENDNIK